MVEKLERKVMEIYGENAATRDIIAYGSDIAGNIVETKDPDVIQTEAYKTGVRAAVVGNNSTTLQNRQALDFLFSRQLKYLYQNGIAEWGADETYYKSSVVKGSDGNIYGSKIDDNVGNNPVGDIANWEQLNGSGFDFEGTKAEFDAAVAAGTITADSVSLITDDVSGENVATKAELQAVDRSKADTALSNVLANIDYVVESKFPTEEDPSWYRVYKSGWVEQGGFSHVTSGAVTVSLSKPFLNTAFSALAMIFGNPTIDIGYIRSSEKTTSTIKFNTLSANSNDTFQWEAKGMGAN